MLHSSDYFVVMLPNGIQSAPYAEEFTLMARALMNTGLVLEILSAGIWMAGGWSRCTSDAARAK